MVLAVIALTTSCSKEQFDKELYNEEVNYQFMVDNADPDHDWCLTKSDTITISTPESSIYSVQILTANPYTSTEAEIAAEAITYTWDGLQATIAYTLPVGQTTAYIAALDENGSYMGVMPFTFGMKEVEVRRANLQRAGSLTQPTYQTFSYLYESSFPVPDDFDYNDMVLRISKKLTELSNSTSIDLTVTLEACGASELYASAIQLVGIKTNEIEKVEIVSGKAMDDGYPINPREFITNTSTLQSGRNGNAVIRLFESAQWALAKQKDDLGEIGIIRYNTAHEDVKNFSATVSPVTTTYRITFKNREIARNFTIDHVDPFIIHRNEDSGGIFEVHTYAHKFDLCISDIETNLRAYDNHVSWALVIPKRDFRYPSEGMSICNYNKDTDETFGPYMGFAEWMKNRLGNRSWYQTLNYPSMVY